jgi:hypothetical protein
MNGSMRDLTEDKNHLVLQRRFSFKIARFSLNTAILPLYDVDFSSETLNRIRYSGADLFSWVDRSFLDRESDRSWQEKLIVRDGVETIALLRLRTFQEWLEASGKQMRKVRNMLRKAQKSGVQVHEIDLGFINGDIVDSIYRIYHDTPIRQGRRYVGYTTTRADLQRRFGNLTNSLLVGAFLEKSMIGFAHIILGDMVASVRSILSLEQYMGMGSNNAMLAFAIESLCSRMIRFLTYARMGYQPGLDMFKKDNGFKRVVLRTHHLALSSRGALATRLNMYRDIPFSAETFRLLLPMYNLSCRVLPFSFGE